MKLSDEELRSLYQGSTATSACLSEELLVRAGRGDLTTEEREHVATHIASCSRCARDYQIAYALRPVGEELRPRSMRWLPLAAAAALLLAIPALVWMYLAQQRQERTIATLEGRLQAAEERPAPVPAAPQIVELSRPQIGMPIVDLDPDPTRGGEEDTPLISLPPTSDLFALILHLDDPVPGPVDLVVQDAGGETVWSERWNASPGSTSVTLTLHGRQFPPGSYQIRIADTVYRFRVDRKR